MGSEARCVCLSRRTEESAMDKWVQSSEKVNVSGRYILRLSNMGLTNIPRAGAIRESPGALG